jgi:superfamily II DNA/RNA helicase
MSNKQQLIGEILKNTGFSALNDLQLETLKKSEQFKDLLILSQTGSGKTLAFLLPLVLNLKTDFPFHSSHYNYPLQRISHTDRNCFSFVEDRT